MHDPVGVASTPNIARPTPKQTTPSKVAMKIFTIENNFPLAEGNKSQLSALEIERPVVCCLPDTALQTRGRPYFSPAFADPCRCQLSVAVRIGRLGKCIGERFAYRYVDAVTVGAVFTATRLQEELAVCGLPWDVSKGFDNAAVVGTFKPVSSLDEINAAEFTLEEDERLVQSGSLAACRFTVAQLVAHISKVYLLRQGDIIFVGYPHAGHEAKLDSRLTGHLNGERLLSFLVK